MAEYKTNIDYIYNDDALRALKTMESGSVNCIVTSPPYLALRDYGVDGQIGLEQTPEEYIQKLVDVFHEAKRVLKDDGTLWLNIGDSYWGSGSRGFDFTELPLEHSQIQKGSKGTLDLSAVPKLVGNVGVYKNKDLIGIPWMLAFALRADGWYLRQDIIWAKANNMPESVKDRCTKSHEYIFLLSKNEKYYFDNEAIQEEAVSANDKRAGKGRLEYDGKRSDTDSLNVGKSFVSITDKRNKRDVWSDGAEHYKNLQEKGQQPNTMHIRRAEGLQDVQYETRNKRDVWRVSTKPVKEAHFATFPEELITPCVLAGCPKNGVVLDPFLGSGTTGVVAHNLGRHYVGIELNPKYVEIAKRRISKAAYQMDLLEDCMQEA